jgi:CBS domain-containing protein
MMTRTRPTDLRMVLAATTAEDLMTPNPISIQANATVQEAVVLMTDRGYSAAPVIDDAGRPIGVLSRTDILVHSREHGRHAPLFDSADWDAAHAHRPKEGFSVEVVDSTQVRDIMTPVVFTVMLDTPARQVVEQMLSLKVHHLFVVDEDRALVGVISSLDVLRRMRDE